MAVRVARKRAHNDLTRSGESSRPPTFFGLARQRSEISHTYLIVSELVACFPALQSA
jgi:hypothetical protein